jgi:uncharacterized protein
LFVLFYSFTVDKGVDINARDGKGYTPLITSSQYGHLTVVAYLISRGACIDSEDVSGDTALHWVIYSIMTRSYAQLINIK